MRSLDETKSITEKDKTLLRQIKQIVQGFDPTAEVLLYGSVARGTQSPESDYDLLVLTDAPAPRDVEEKIERELLELEIELSVVLSTIYHSRSEWERRVSLPFHTEVETHGIAL